MTFIPLLGYFILRPDKHPERPIEERRSQGFTGFYARTAKFAIEHRWKVALASLLFLVAGGFLFSQLQTSFFPDDVQYWSYVDVWLPNDVNFETTAQAAQQVEAIIRQQAAEWGKKHPDKNGKPTEILRYVTTWVGGGSPRFWFSLSPQAQQLNYAQVLVELTDKDLTPAFVDQVQPISHCFAARRAQRLPAIANQSAQLPGGNSYCQPRGCKHQGQFAKHTYAPLDRASGGEHPQ